MKPTVASRIARSLEERIRNGSISNIDSVAKIARSHDTSRTTVSQALHELQEKGLVICRRGARTKIAPQFRSSCSGATGEETSVEKFYRSIRSEITDGTLRIGSILPKQQFFIEKECITSTTVTEVFRRLEHEGFLHKKGRRWIVGPFQSESTRSNDTRVHAAVHDSAPVVLIFSPHEVAFREGLINNPFTSRFVNSFSQELMNAGYRKAFQSMGAVHHKGEPRIQECIRECLNIIYKLDSRYAGALVHPGFRLPLLDEWLPELRTRGKPVVLFDSSEVAATYTRKNLGLSNTYFRLYRDEYSDAFLAVKVLVEAGHRRIAFPVFWGGGIDWVNRRAELTREAALSHPGHPQILVVNQTETFWKGPKCERDGSIQERIEARVDEFTCMLGQAGSKRSFRKTVIDATPSMKEIVQWGATGIIAPNDAIAYEYYVWLQTAGIRVPEDISLISFDNAPESETYPISTIDPGFSRLGYLAAHMLIGDIPLNHFSDGNVGGKANLVDRGSIAPPGQDKAFFRNPA